VHFVLDVNGQPRDVNVPSDTPLLTVLREELGLRSTRYGCGHGICGACFVLLDGVSTASCTTSVEAASKKKITTLEGLARDGALHPVQRAFIDERAFQCGYCTSGMIVSAAALLERDEQPSERTIREALEPHLCRCGVYLRAIRAVKRAAQ